MFFYLMSFIGGGLLGVLSMHYFGFPIGVFVALGLGLFWGILMGILQSYSNE